MDADAAESVASKRAIVREGRRTDLSQRLFSADGATGLLTFATIASLAAASGGYFPTAWNWAALALFWVVGVGLLVPQDVRYGRLEFAFVGGLCAFVAWVAASITWSTHAPQTVLEVQRDLVYPAGVAALLLLARRRSTRSVLAGLLVAVTVICVYALATRLFPERLGSAASFGGYRLARPLGYWNALGIFASMGGLLALGLAARARSVAGRAAAAAALPVLLTTLYFTYSRGAWIALAAGLVATIALDARRLQLITISAPVLVPATAAVLIASRSSALTRTAAPLASVSDQGHRLALTTAVSAIVSGGLAVALAAAERRLRIGRRARIAYAGLLSLVAAAGLVAVFVVEGSPWTAAHKAYVSFKAPVVGRPKGASLNGRLLSLSNSGRIDLWHVAWRDYEHHQALGSGAGSFEVFWDRQRSEAFKARDAHSLYVETLAELGPVGLGLLVVVLALPLAGGFRTRGHPLVSPAFGAYVAYLVHAGADWDWEMTAVTLLALFLGAAMLLPARGEPVERKLAMPTRVVALAGCAALLAFSFVGLIGNGALASAQGAFADKDWKSAEMNARRAVSWAPWSSSALDVLGTAQSALGRQATAYRTLRKAVSKDSNNWSLWYDLGDTAPTTAASRRAYKHAARLNPLSPSIAMLRGLGILPRRRPN